MLIYIAHRFSEGQMENMIAVRRICQKIVAENPGVVPVAPHLMFPWYIEDKDHRAEIIVACCRIIESCDQVWIYGPISPGMADEISHAKQHGIECIHRGIK